MFQALPGESNLQVAAFCGEALAESRLALLQYKWEQPYKMVARNLPRC